MDSQPPSDSHGSIEDLKQSVCAFLDSLVAQKAEDANRDFNHVYDRARELVQRKLMMAGTKNETRDLLGEIVFSRLRRGMRGFLSSQDSKSELRCAEWVMGSMLSIGTLAEFSAAVDRAILEMSAPREYSFAGMADFISIEEVLQLLGSGKHIGCLTFEKPDNRIDIYLNGGRIAFLDPHRMVRRMLPGAGHLDYREIPEEMIHQAEREQAEDETPLFLALNKLGAFKDLDLRVVMSELGNEVFHEFLLEPDAVFFSYRRMAELPEYARECDLRMGITGVLLQGNKKVDDWRSMLRVFPDPYEPIKPVEDMYARIGALDLGVVEIKLLAHLNGENHAHAIADAMGLPLYETYQHLVRLAREGAVISPAGDEVLGGLSLSVEESMKLAFEALDANDDQLAVNSALDKVLGGDDADAADSLFSGDFVSPQSAEPEPEEKNGADDSGVRVSLDFLKGKKSRRR